MGKLLFTNGKKLETGGIVCPQCDGEKFSMGMHLDGVAFYENHYSCGGCGEIVVTRYERDKESMAYWGGDNDES